MGGRRESDSQVFCRSNSVHVCDVMEKTLRPPPPPPPPLPFSFTRLHTCGDRGCALAASQMVAGRDEGGVGSRQLRSWRRHVRTTVAMELATALHHSAQRVEVTREGEVHEKHVGPRAQKRPLLGTRPAPLAEVPAPQVGAVTVGHVAAPIPRLAGHRLQGDDGVDVTTLWYLLGHAIEMRKALEEEEEEEERRKNEEEEQVKAARSSASSAPKRTRKKKDEASTSSWCSDSAMWAWVPLSLFVVWCLLGIMAGTCQKDSCALIVCFGSGLCKGGFAGYYGPRFMFPSVDDRPKMLDIMAGTDQKNSYALLMCKVGFYW